MGGLPDSPDEIIAVVIILAILGGAALVAGGRLVLWVAGLPIWRRLSVNHSASGSAEITSSVLPAGPPAPAFRQEPEREPEREPAPEPPAAAPAPAGKLYTPDQIEKLLDQARDAGAARALGLLLGAGLLDQAARPAAMELIYGKRGRRHQAARPLIDQAAASVEPAAPAARLVPVNGDGPDHVEL